MAYFAPPACHGKPELPPAAPAQEVIPVIFRAFVIVLLARFQVPAVNVTFLALAAFAAFSP